MKVSKKTVCDVWDLPYRGSEEDGVKIVSDKIVDHSRWSVEHELVVQIADKYYITFYSRGATEYQSEMPWEYDDEVEFTEVTPVQKTITVYEPKKEA